MGAMPRPAAKRPQPKFNPPAPAVKLSATYGTAAEAGARAIRDPRSCNGWWR